MSEGQLSGKKSCLASPSRIIRVSSTYWITGKSGEEFKGMGKFRRPPILGFV
jgi:hypothetical protein